MWFDVAAVEAVVDALPLWVAMLLLIVSYLGSVYVLAPAALVAYFRGVDWRTATWPGIMIGAYGLFVALKPLSNVPRPSHKGVESPLAGQALPPGIEYIHHMAVEFSSSSFPSGHAIALTVFVGLAVADLDIGTFRQRLGVGAVVVGVVSFSRVGLGVHFVGDMIGGVIIALLFLGVVFLIRERLYETHWRGIDPASGMFLLALAPGALSMVSGRPADGLLVLIAAVVGLAIHRSIEPRGLTLELQPQPND